MQSVYDLTVLNAMNEVQDFFEDMVTEAYNVSEFDDVPADVQEVEVVRFAELSEDTIRDILMRALSTSPFANASMTVDGVVNATITKLNAAKSKVAKDKWPKALMNPVAASQSNGDARAVTMMPPAEEPTGDAEATDANHKKLLTARYDLKTMTKMQQINNKFNDALVGFYGVADEDDLPEPVIGFVFGDVVMNNKWDVTTIRVELEKVIRANPWKNMDDSKLTQMLDDCMAELKPFADKMLASVLEHDSKTA